MATIRVGDYFDICRGNAKEISSREHSSAPESIRLISATGFNNGGDLYVIPRDNETIYRDQLAVGNNGSVGLGKVFYHSYPFVATSDVTILFCKDKHHISLNQGLYIKSAMEKQRGQFAYGFKLSNHRLKNMQIQVPLTREGNIDWTAMDLYIQNLKKQIVHLPNTQNEIETSLKLTSRDWKQFTLGELFGLPHSGKDYPQYLRLKGTIPFVGSSSKNNGITGYIQKEKSAPDCFATHTISINRNGSVGFSFYHPYEAYFSGDTRYFLMKNKNKYVALFVTTLIMQQKDQFGYGFKLGTKRLFDLKINVPVDKLNQPDWKFMEDYIKSLPNGDLV